MVTTIRRQRSELRLDAGHPELVAGRLTEAYRVVASMPMSTTPKAFGNSWPQFLACHRVNRSSSSMSSKLKGCLQVITQTEPDLLPALSQGN